MQLTGTQIMYDSKNLVVNLKKQPLDVILETDQIRPGNKILVRKQKFTTIGSDDMLEGIICKYIA